MDTTAGLEAPVTVLPFSPGAVSITSRKTKLGKLNTIERHLKKYFDAHWGELPAPGLYDRIFREVERPLISLTLSVTSGNQVRAAKVLGLNRNTLRKKIRELNIDIVRSSQ